MDDQISSAPPVPPVLPPTEESKDWFKILLVIIGFLIVLGLFGNIFLLLQKENQKPTAQITPTPTQTAILPIPTVDPTASWKTYKFEPLQLSLKVPPELIVHTEEPNPGNDFTAYIQNYPFNAPAASEDAYQLYIIWQKTPTITQAEFQQLKNDLDTNSVEDSTINGYLAIKGQVKGERSRFAAYILKGDTKISLFTSEPTQANKERTDQILSTFKFLE